ncbi:MAG: hypothetical protein ACRDIB_04060, partial [Ardenticatenaceae bacterium]
RGMFVYRYGIANPATCSPAAFYDIKGRPAEAALSELPKEYVPAQALFSEPITLLSDVDDPHPIVSAFRLTSPSGDALYWQTDILLGSEWIALDFISAPMSQPIRFTADPSGLELGTYMGTLELTVETDYDILIPVSSSNQTRTVTLRVLEEVYDLYIPLSIR